MIAVELQDNFDGLREFRAAAERRVKLDGEHPLTNIERRDAFGLILLPTWKQTTWESLAVSVPLAFKEEEITQITGFYRDLNELTKLDQARSNPACRDRFEAKLDALLSKGRPLV